ncbi:hypothetical protein B0H13DRAFT_2151010, partial [Mycena leptocephala]
MALLAQQIQRAKLTCARLDSETAERQAQNLGYQTQLEEARFAVLQAKRAAEDERTERAVRLQGAISHSTMLQVELKRLEQKENSAQGGPLSTSALRPAAHKLTQSFGIPSHTSASSSTAFNNTAGASSFSTHRNPSPTRASSSHTSASFSPIFSNTAGTLASSNSYRNPSPTRSSSSHTSASFSPMFSNTAGSSNSYRNPSPTRPALARIPASHTQPTSTNPRLPPRSVIIAQRSRTD